MIISSMDFNGLIWKHRGQILLAITIVSAFLILGSLYVTNSYLEIVYWASDLIVVLIFVYLAMLYRNKNRYLKIP